MDKEDVDCSPPGSSVHGIFQAGILEWVAIAFSRGSSPPRDRTGSPALQLQTDALSPEPPGKPNSKESIGIINYGIYKTEKILFYQ